MVKFLDFLHPFDIKREKFRVSGANNIAPDLKQSVYEVAIREGGSDEFDFLLEKLLTVGVANAAEVNKIIYGLGSSRDVMVDIYEIVF